MSNSKPTPTTGDSGFEVAAPRKGKSCSWYFAQFGVSRVDWSRCTAIVVNLMSEVVRGYFIPLKAPILFAQSSRICLLEPNVHECCPWLRKKAGGTGFPMVFKTRDAGACGCGGGVEVAFAPPPPICCCWWYCFNICLYSPCDHTIAVNRKNGCKLNQDW